MTPLQTSVERTVPLTGSPDILCFEILSQAGADPTIAADFNETPTPLLELLRTRSLYFIPLVSSKLFIFSCLCQLTKFSDQYMRVSTIAAHTLISRKDRTPLQDEATGLNCA